jgi:hypothetical protein
MREISSSVAIEIGAGETASFKVARSTQVTVQCGVVWLSRSLDNVDYFLFSGDVLKLRRGERLWLSAEGVPSARLSFQVAPQPAAQGMAAWARARARSLWQRNVCTV